MFKKDKNFLFNESIRFKIKKKQLSNYNNFTFNNKFTKQNTLNNFSLGLKFLWISLRFWIISIITTILVLLTLIISKMIPIYKISFIFFILSSFFYWLISGFTFFIKKYQYRYFTSSIQRFWKRTFALFWMLEFFLFFCFFYLTLNASQEPFFMFDNVQIFKTHLFSWKIFLTKIYPTLFCLLLINFLIYQLKYSNFSKLSFLIIVITFLIFYILWIEFYQFFHVVSYYNSFQWKFDEEENYWFLENELKRTRIINHFLTICLVAKFWHVVFSAYFWLFFILRGLELKKIRFPLLAATFQNIFFIYILSWLYMYPWFKYFISKLFNTPYYWFYVNNKRLCAFLFFNDFKVVIISIINEIYLTFKSILLLDFYHNSFFKKDFLFNVINCTNDSNSEIKNIIFKKIFFKDLV